VQVRAILRPLEASAAESGTTAATRRYSTIQSREGGSEPMTIEHGDTPMSRVEYDGDNPLRLANEIEAALVKYGVGSDHRMCKANGQRILTASEDGRAQIWSRDTGEVVSVLTAEKLRMKDAGFCLALRGQSREECACRVFGVWHERSFSQAGELGQAANPLCSCWGTCEMAKLS
jgi:hypothetical protein